MKNNTIILDLGKYQTAGAKVFTGRPRGIEVRNKSNIDLLQKDASKVLVIIPESISSINPSFLEELFKNIVVEIGREAFLEKFKFENNGRYKIDNDLFDAIERILDDENALI